MTEQQILFKLTSLCSVAEHCSSEMIDKMRKMEVDEATQAKIMEYLVKEKYVDDERYCRYFVKEKIKFNKWGRRKVEMALFQKRIPKEISRSVLDDVDDAEYINVLKPLIKQKEKTIKANSEYEKNMKLVKFAIGRGFTFDIIKTVLGSSDIDDIDEDEL